MIKPLDETIAVREGEELNKEKIAAFLSNHVPEAPSGHLDIRQFASGHSNLTYLLQIDQWQAVLRRPPFGPLPPRAHDMKREYQFLSMIHPYYSLAPKPIAYTDDESIIGREFFIMERKAGIVLDTSFPEEIKYKAEMGKRISELMVDYLVTLHEIDYEQTKLLQLTKPDHFMERQVSGWIKRYKRAQTEEIPNVDRVINYLESNIPQQTDKTIIHYDYKLNNAMFTSDFSDMVGLFDWEMSTVGDPLADLAVAMSYWIQEDDNDTLKYGLGHPPVTVKDGFFTREEFIQRYAEKSKRDVSSIAYYLTFAYFKLAVIGQQIYYRYHQGQTRDKRFANFNVLVQNMIQEANKSM